MKSVSLIAALFTLTLFATPRAASAADEFDVESAWRKDCASCHAKDGSGLTKKGRRLRVQDYRDPEVQAKLSDEEMVTAIKQGTENDGEQTMNPYDEDYSDAEIEAFIAYIRAMAKQ